VQNKTHQQDSAWDDDRLVSLVVSVLDQPSREREAYLRRECAGDLRLFEQAADYVQWEERMGGFLLEPFCTLDLFDPALEPGELLEERFRIVREVGEGGMAIVYEAMDEKLRKRIAIKCAKAGFHTRLTPEVRHATEISHHNVCKIFEIHTAETDRGEIDFITMEFLEGQTLAARLRGGRLPEPEARAIARQLSAGLTAAHRNQVIHGDLKSNNIILTKAADGSPRAVITDFGLSHGSGAGFQPAGPALEGSDTAVGGTRDYMAPELWQGSRASVASDLYALGVIFYEMISGQRPHQAIASTAETDTLYDRRPSLDAAAIWEERLTRRPPPVHSKWDQILGRCLDPEPTRRFATAEELGSALAPRSRLWVWTVAAAAVMAAISGIVTNERATAAKETVRLAVLPFETDTGTTSIAQGLLREVSRQADRIKSNARTKFVLVSPKQATHTLRATLSSQPGKIIVRAHVTDQHSRRNSRDWQFEYKTGDLRYAPLALAGIVTAQFRLPPLAANATINAAATQDYWNGMYSLRRNSTLGTALALLGRAVAEDPASPLTYAGLAEARWYEYRLAREQVWLDRTRESLLQAEDFNPDLGAVHRIEGCLDYAAGFYERAVAEFQRAIELDPKDGSAHMWLGLTDDVIDHPDDAVEELQKAVTLEPDYVRVYQGLGGVYLHQSKFEEGLRYHEKAVELAPDEANLRFNLAGALLDMGQFSEAERELRHSIALQETLSAVLSLGVTLMYERKDQEALTFLERASTLDFPPGGTRRYTALMYLGIALRRLGMAGAALQANRRGLMMAETDLLNPRDGYARSFVAYFDAALGDRDRAEAEITQALGLSGISEVRWNAVLAYEALKLRDKTLMLLATSTVEQLTDVNHWPDLVDLQRDPRFLQLLAAHHIR
jgi:serine/threonine protein kinase/tetratricopeptide (TPR) repeat protein